MIKDSYNSNKCLIIGWYGFNNVGDELILHALLSYLKTKSLDLVVVSANPQQTKKIHGIHSIPITWSVLKHFRLTNTVIFGGGQIFSDKRFRTIPLWSAILGIFNLLNRNSLFILLNQGMESTNKLLLMIVKSALSSANLISVRDSASFRLVKNLNIDVPLLFGPDIIFTLDLGTDENKLAYADKSHKITIGINLRPSFWWGNKVMAHRFEKIIASSLDMLIDELDVELIFTPFRLSGREEYDDLEFSKTVISHMRYKDHTTIFNCSFDKSMFSSLIDQFNQFDLFIGVALHSLMLSFNLGIPFLAIPYQKKCELFMEDAGIASLMIKPLEMISSGLMFKRIVEAWGMRGEIKTSLLSKQQTMLHDSKRAHIDPLSRILN